MNKKGHLATYIGLPGPFAKACKILLALFPLDIGPECQSSWEESCSRRWTARC